MKVSERYGCGGVYATIPSFCASMECELEAIRSAPKLLGNWKCVPDNSLRNNGVEYISAVGRDRKTLVEDFKSLHQGITFMDKEDPFSARTSTHVHVNVSSIEEDHARNMVILYALYEEMFFALVKPTRRDNIHCVPLTDTPLVSIYNKRFDSFVASWHKYTALNLKRITDLGTIEFRHMHGTGDAEEIDVWLHVLENLWKLAQRVEINEKTLADKTIIVEWFETIFFPADKIMALKTSLLDIIRNSLIDVKISTL